MIYWRVMQKDFDKWNKEKKVINSQPFTGFIHEREMWGCSIGVNVGDEQDGKNDRFERPVLVLRKYNKHVVLGVPLTTKLKQNPYYFPFIHEGIQFAVILSQVRLLSTNRFTRRIRRIDQKLFAQIKEALIERAI